jgi:hypothetical protein
MKFNHSLGRNIGFRPDGRWKIAGGKCRFGHAATGKSCHQGFAPGWALEHNRERGTENPTGNENRTSFHRPSGREPLRTEDPVVCPKRQTTGYCPAPIRAKANSEEPNFHPPFMGTCTQLSVPTAKSPVAVWILPLGFNLEKEDKSVN